MVRTNSISETLGIVDEQLITKITIAYLSIKINKFEKIIKKLGNNYVDILGEDSSILEEFYSDN